MHTRSFLWFLLPVFLAMSAGCVSPYYGNAQITPGPHYSGGVALATYQYPYTDPESWDTTTFMIGIRGDFNGGYGLNRYIGGYLRGGLGLNLIPPAGILLDGGIGVQAALPLGPVTPALRTEIARYGGFWDISPTLLVGIGWPEEFDWVIMGIRTHFLNLTIDAMGYLPTDVFLNVHVTEEFSIFAGVEINSLLSTINGEPPPYATIGVGYSFLE